MHAEPITCYRPRPEAAAELASLPYDVYDRASAAAFVAAHPRSFLAIDRPEASFPPDHDPYADDVYQRAHDLLAERVSDGTLLRDGTPCYYLYRLVKEGREQTGIVAACAIDDYANGIVRRHELTRPVKEDDRVRHIEATGCQTGPIYLAYRDNPVMEALVEAAKLSDPLYDFTDEQGVRHTIWRVARPAAVESFRAMFAYVPCAYIVDGHHRAAAAARVCRRMRTEGGDGHTGDEAYNYLLCALFPAGQLTVEPYDRVVADCAGLDEEGLVASLEACGMLVGARRPEPVLPSERGRFGMYAFGEVTAITTTQGMVATGTLVIAYAFIIGAIIFDFVKRRPYRKRAQAQVSALTEKKLAELFEQERAAQLERRAAKEARRSKK